jgi:hypothetical protein
VVAGLPCAPQVTLFRLVLERCRRLLMKGVGNNRNLRMHGFVAAESFGDVRRFAVRKLRIERQECAPIPVVEANLAYARNRTSWARTCGSAVADKSQDRDRDWLRLGPTIVATSDGLEARLRRPTLTPSTLMA